MQNSTEGETKRNPEGEEEFSCPCLLDGHFLKLDNNQSSTTEWDINKICSIKGYALDSGGEKTTSKRKDEQQDALSRLKYMHG